MTLDEQIRFMQTLGDAFGLEAARMEGIAVLQAQAQQKSDACCAIATTLIAERDRRNAMGADWT